MYPACQNLLLAARALGYGGVLTGWHAAVANELHALLGIPDRVEIMATITLGKPQGRHGPVRRRPLPELVYGEQWESAPSWAVDPEDALHTAAGPPPAHRVESGPDDDAAHHTTASTPTTPTTGTKGRP